MAQKPKVDGYEDRARTGSTAVTSLERFFNNERSDEANFTDLLTLSSLIERRLRKEMERSEDIDKAIKEKRILRMTVALYANPILSLSVFTDRGEFILDISEEDFSLRDMQIFVVSMTSFSMFGIEFSVRRINNKLEYNIMGDYGDTAEGRRKSSSPQLGSRWAEARRGKKQVKLRLDPSLLEEVDAAVEAAGIDRNSWIEAAIQRTLKPS